MSQATLGDVLRYLRTTSAGELANDLTDGELLERFLVHREEAAFTLLVQRHGPMVLSVCCRVLGNGPSAEDSFQATFLILVRRAASIRKKESLASWLYAVALHLASKARAQTARRQQRERRAADMPEAETLDELTWQELRSVLDEEIGRLAEKYRAPLVLCYFEDKSYEQAAQELGWPKSTLANRLARARQLLHGQLMRRGIALTVGALATALVEKAAGCVVPALLTLNTVQAARSAAAGKVAASCLSAGAAALAEEAMKPVLGMKRKLVLLVAALTVAVSAGLAGHGALEQKSPSQPKQPTATFATNNSTDGPTKKDVPALDFFGDTLPSGAVARLGTVRWRGGVRVTGLAFSPDGKTLASSSVAGFGLCLWDTATGRPLHRLVVPFICDRSPAYAPDSKTLIVAGGFRGQANRLYLVEVATGKILRRIDGAAGVGLDTVAFSSDGHTVATSESGGAAPTIVLWDVVAGKEIVRLPGHTGTIQAVAFSRDGTLLASAGDDKTVRLWDVTAGKELGRMAEQAKPVTQVGFAPGGKVLASLGQDGVVRLWDVATTAELRCLKTDEDRLRSFAFAQQGKLLATAEVGGLVRLWDTDTGKELRRWSANPKFVSGVAFAPDGKVLATAGWWEHAIRLWDPATGKEIQPATGHTALVEWLRFAPDGKTLYSGGGDSKVVAWDTSTAKERDQLVAGPLSAGEASSTSTVTSILSPDGKILARANKYGTDGTIRLWEATSGKELHTLVAHGPAIMRLRFSSDGKLLVSEAFDGTRVWEVATGKQLYHLEGSAGAAFSPDGKFLAAGGQSDKTIRLLEAATGKEIRRWESGQQETWRLLFSPDGKWLVSSGVSGSGASIWAIDTGQLVRSVPVLGYVDALAFSCDSRLLAAVVRRGRTLADGDVEETSTIQIWEALSGQEIRRMDVLQGWVGALAFAPNGRTLASGGSDSTILLWDLTGGVTHAKAKTAALTAGELAGLWADLAGDAAPADRALWKLALVPQQSVPFLREQLRPPAPADAKLVAGLLADLESKDFAVRQKAAGNLEVLGDAAIPALRQALESSPTLEVRQQVEKLLGKRTPTVVRQLRAIAALEYAGTAEARQVLEALANTTPHPPVAQGARAALQRLGGV
jgi:RNA polymerase sigma factor (sigma-70 family)